VTEDRFHNDECRWKIFETVDNKIGNRWWLWSGSLWSSQLRYFITAGKQIEVLTGSGAAAWQTAPRDQFIGWNPDQRKTNLHLIVNNAGFLILPWIQSKNLAS